MKRTLTAIVLSFQLIFGCSPEKIEKNVDAEEGELHFEKKTRFINLIVGNNKYDLSLRFERHDGEIEHYTGKAEGGEYILERVTISNTIGSEEYEGSNIPEEYNRKFNDYIQEAKED